VIIIHFPVRRGQGINKEKGKNWWRLQETKINEVKPVTDHSIVFFKPIHLNVHLEY